HIAPGIAHASDFPGDYIAKALAEAVRGKSVNIDGLAEGEMLSAEFVGRTIYIYRRTGADLARLERQSSSELADPTDQRFRESVRREFGSTSSTVWARLLLAAEPIAKRPPTRSLDKTLLVVAGWGPGSGCALAITSAAEREAKGFLFRDPCTGATFDAAGRALSPSKSAGGAPFFNIAVPPYRLERQNVLLGPATAASLPALPFSQAELNGAGTPTQRLIGAARYNDIGAVREAIRSGADVRYFRPGEGSPLDAAIIGSSTEVIRLLLQHGAQPTPNSEAAAQFLGRQDVLTLLR
ncbi:hypothetical protein QWZ02_19820, partial [Kinneretia asaccharophila]